MEARESIRLNAEMVVEQMQQVCGFDFGYDVPSVQWLDEYIERQRSREYTDPEFFNRMVNVFGSYLGECVVHAFGGEWKLVDGSWAVSFDEKNAVFPFNKVRKRYEFGSEDSLYSFFTLIPVLYPHAGIESKALDRQDTPP